MLLFINTFKYHIFPPMGRMEGRWKMKVNYMLLFVRQCFLLTLSRKIIVFKQTLQTTNKFFQVTFLSKEDSDFVYWDPKPFVTPSLTHFQAFHFIQKRSKVHVFRINKVDLGGLGVTCSPRDPRFARVQIKLKSMDFFRT